LTASGIFWKEDEVRRRERGVGVVQRIPFHTTQTPHHHFIYMGIQGGGGVGRRKQVEEVEFLSKRDKWIGWDSLQEETSGRGAILLNIVLLCANCCVQRRREVSDVEYSQNCR
jgi:hypothetical protein